MSQSFLSQSDTVQFGRLTLQDSPDVVAAVADRNISDGLGLSPAELLEVFKNRDSWIWNRLLPCDIYTSSADLPLYESYLQQFYEANKHSVASAGDAVIKCLEKENSLRELWMSLKVDVIRCDAILSDKILKCMSRLVGTHKERQSLCPFIAVAAACIEGEAELMINWLTGHKPHFKEFVLSRYIRRCALELAAIEGCEWSCVTAALPLGIKKEAEWLCQNMRCDGFYSGNSIIIRGCALDFMSWKISEYNSTSSDEDLDAAVDMDIPVTDHKTG